MNIFDFFSSQDIAAHCQSIGHTFNALEMAVLISWSHKPIKDKLTAWQWIIENCSDMPIHKNGYMDARDSLHEYLREVIVGEEKNRSDFYNCKSGQFYRVDVCKKHGVENSGLGGYSTIEKAWEAFCGLYNWEKDGISSVTIEKVTIDSKYFDYVYVNSAGEATSVYIKDGFRSSLSDIFIHIPVPFETGDLVEFGDGQPHVLQSHPHDISLPSWKYEDFVAGSIGDSTDLQAGFYYFENGTLTWEHHGFLSLRYFKGSLTGQEQFLQNLSEYLKCNDNPIALPWLLNAFSKYSVESDFKNLNERFIWKPRSKEDS